MVCHVSTVNMGGMVCHAPSTEKLVGSHLCVHSLDQRP